METISRVVDLVQQEVTDGNSQNHSSAPITNSNETPDNPPPTEPNMRTGFVSQNERSSPDWVCRRPTNLEKQFFSTILLSFIYVVCGDGSSGEGKR